MNIMNKTCLDTRDKRLLSREQEIEGGFINATHLRGGRAMKLTSPSMRGMPDRMILLPGGHIGFVEVRSPGKPSRDFQIEQLRKLGFQVFVIDSPEMIESVLDEIAAN